MLFGSSRLLRLRLALAVNLGAVSLAACGASAPPAPVADVSRDATPTEAARAGVRQVHASGDRTCAVTVQGEVWCWGRGIGGVPERVAGLTGVVEVSVGTAHACARSSEGQVHCWGAGADGQLGDLGEQLRREPVRAQVDGVVQLATGAMHTCALREGGEVWCWGEEDVAIRTRGDNYRGGSDSGVPRGSA